MEDLSNGSSVMDFNISVPRIRLLELNLTERLQDLEKKINEKNILEVTTVCEDIKEKILNYEDEFQLSKCFNNYRRIHIASELLINICSLHDRVVDFEFTKTVNDLLDVEKFKEIARRILKRKRFEVKREKYFIKEADSKILTEDVDKRMEEESKPDENVSPKEQEKIQSQGAPQLQQKSSGTLNLPPDISAVTEYLSRNLEEMTEIREEVTGEIPNLRGPSEALLTEDISVPAPQPEISVRETNVEMETEEALRQILQTLEDQINVENIPNVDQSKNLLESREEVFREPQQSLDVLGSVNAETEFSDEFKLSSLELDEPIRKRQRLKIDKKTYIPNYAARALELNKNIMIKRVQVFEGPPNILQSVSVDYMMKTPGFGSSIFHVKKIGRLNDLYTRNLITDKKSHEKFPEFPLRKLTEFRASESIPVRKRTDVEKEYVKIGMHSSQERKDVLSDLYPDMNRTKPTLTAAVERESLNGVPLSRIMQGPIEPIAFENIITMPQKIPSPLQQLQGKKLDPKRSPPWFYSPEKDPPSPEWKKFAYVLQKLENYWSLFEIQENEKSITLHEFLILEDSYNIANYLTLLRILDKLSLQRKLILDYKQDGIHVKPFETPFVTNMQLLLKNKEPIF